MENTESKTETILIPEEIIHPLVKKHLDNVSAAQWAMLASGEIEPELEAVITGLLTEIIQSVSTVLIKIVLPKIHQTSPEDSEPAEPSVPTVKPNFGNSLLLCLSGFFNTKQPNLEEGKELTELAEAEIEEKVRSYLSEAASQETLPSKPALFVNGITSNIERLGQMVRQATRYLKGCLSSPNNNFGRQCVEVSEELCLVSSNPKSPESVKSVTGCISDIVRKWTTPQTGQESGHVPASSPSRSAHNAAGEILDIIMGNVKSPEKEEPCGSSESGAPQRSCFDMTLIVDKVRGLTAPSANTGDSDPKLKSICRFAETYFNNLKGDLKNFGKKLNEQLVINMTNDPRSWDFVFPGSIPETPKPSSESRQKRLKTVVKQQTSEMNFDTFKRNLDDLMTEMTLSDEEFHTRLEGVTQCCEVKNFSKELTDKMYDHLMTEHVYHMPIVPKGRCLSDSVISKIEKKMDGHQRSFSPEVLYAMTEDAVGKFVQQIFLFLIKDTSEPIAENENALGALRDIENLLKVGIPTPEDTKAESESSQESAPASVHLSQDGEKADVVIENREGEEDASKTAPVEDETSQAGDLPQEGRESPELSGETLTNSLTLALLLRLLSMCETDHKDVKDDIVEIKKRLLFLVVPPTDVENCEPTVYAENMKDALNVNIKALRNRFASLEKILGAATAANNSAFDKVLITTLKYELDVKIPTKKGKIRRFFSAIGKKVDKTVKFLRKTYREL